MINSEYKGPTGKANKYELVVVAALEARRLNDFYRRALKNPPARVTLEAVDRVRGGLVRYAIENDEEPSI